MSVWGNVATAGTHSLDVTVTAGAEAVGGCPPTTSQGGASRQGRAVAHRAACSLSNKQVSVR